MSHIRYEELDYIDDLHWIRSVETKNPSELPNGVEKEYKECKNRVYLYVSEIKKEMQLLSGKEEYADIIAKMDKYLKDDYFEFTLEERTQYMKVRDELTQGVLKLNEELSAAATEKAAKKRLEKDKAEKAKAKLILRKNKAIDAYNKKQGVKNDLYRKHLKYFLTSLDNNSTFNKFKNSLDDKNCINPEFVRGYISAINAVLNQKIGEHDEFYPYKDRVKS